MGSEDYDSTGKSRAQDSRSRSGALVVALAAGVCLGVMFSERLYIHYQVPPWLHHSVVPLNVRQ